MSKSLKNILFAVVLFPAAIYSGSEPVLQGSPYSVQQYRCEMISHYIYLREISNEFGNILLSENYENIFLASIDAVGSLDGMKHELESADVPGEMHEAHDVFLKSVDSYRQSADLIRIAIGTFLGEYERTETDIQELIDLSVHHVTTANKYLALSLVLHGNLFDAYAQGSNECKKYVAGNY